MESWRPAARPVAVAPWIATRLPTRRGDAAVAWSALTHRGEARAHRGTGAPMCEAAALRPQFISYMESRPIQPLEGRGGQGGCVSQANGPSCTRSAGDTSADQYGQWIGHTGHLTTLSSPSTLSLAARNDR